MSTDRREYVRVSVDLPDHPKLANLDDPAAGWLYVTAMCYCGRNLTDGVFPLRMVLRIAGVEKDRAEALEEAGLWHFPGHECTRCPQPGTGEVVLHDYLQHQRSKAEAQETRAKKSMAGAMGAAKRWGNKNHASPVAPAIAPAIANGWQADSKPMAEVEVEVEEELPSHSVARTTSAPASRKRPQRAQRQAATTPPAQAPSQQAVALWVDTYRAACSSEPTKNQIGQVARESKQLLDAGNTEHRVAEAVRSAATKGRASLTTEFGLLASTRNGSKPSGHQPYRDPDPSEYHQRPGATA